MVVISVKIAVLTVAMLAATTEAHNKMTLPLPTWADGFYNQNSPSGTIDPTNVLPVPTGMSYNTDSTSNTKAYWTAFNSSKYASLKELVWDAQTLAASASNECGFSLVNGMARDLPDKVQWDFFTASHQGPCEVWCDNTLVFENWNCAVDYTETPANLPYDKAKCEGSSVLTSYWIALHTTPWQVYTNCAKLTGASSSSNSSSSTTTNSASGTSESKTTTTPATTSATPTTTSSTSTKTITHATTTATPTATPATQTEASEEESSTGDEASTDAEAEAPAMTTAPSTEKCSVRRRRY